MKKLIPVILSLFLLANCNENKVELKWKLQPDEKLIYKTRMEIQKDKSFVSSEIEEALKEAYHQLEGDTTGVFLDLDDSGNLMVEYNNAVQYFSFLEPFGNSINLEVVGNRKHKIRNAKFPLTNLVPLENRFFSGRINPNGSITNNESAALQKYIINILFELPKEPVAIGDTWQLDIKTYDFNKKPNVNKVQLVDIVTEGGQELAILEYNIKGKGNKSMMQGIIDYKGTAEFNITKGRWDKFYGTLVYSATGFTEMLQTQKIGLEEVSETAYNQLLEQYRKANSSESIDNSLAKNKEGQERGNANFQEKEVIEVANNELTNNSSDCPVIYGVQILATAKPMPSSSKEFQDLPYKVEEKYVSNEEKFKYKYIVGNECSKSQARKLKKQIRRQGFPGAFVVQK